MFPMISLSGVQFSYSQAADSHGLKRRVFEGLSLDIPPASVTAVLGPNGAGKSTLLHLILGHLSPVAGSIQIAGQALRHYSRRDMGSLVGLVAQDEQIPFNFTVLEYVLLGRAPYLQLLQMPGAQDMEAASQALALAGVIDLAERSVLELSGGERRLVMIARALAQQPRVLLLDEPTSHLDLSNKRHVLGVLQDRAASGVTVVFTTHEPDLVAAVADYVILMRAGVTLAAGAVDAVFTSDNLTRTYDVPVKVVDIDGRRIVLA